MFTNPVPRGRWRKLAFVFLLAGCSDDAITPETGPANLPPLVSAEIPRQILVPGTPPRELDLSAYFAGPDGHSLTFAAAALDTSIVVVVLEQGVLSLSALASGQAVVSVTASDAQGRSAATTFAVWVTEDPDRAALVALYEATNGPNWINSENWLTDAPLADWYGVTTDERGRVLEVVLSGEWDSEAHGYVHHGLAGPIPPELGNLASLQRLELSMNQLSGPIPPELGNLASLEYLELDRNELTGPIPPELGNLASLQYLELSQNQLTGPLPPELGNLASLESLGLARNQLTGPIPPELGNLASLHHLQLSINQLSGPIPPELGNLASLLYLELAGNQLSGPLPPELGNLASLESLGLAANLITGTIPRELGSMTQLKWLDLTANLLLDGSLPPELGNLTSLESLGLTQTGLGGPLPRELGELAQLRELIAWGSGFTGPIPPQLGKLRNLKRLDFDFNYLEGPIPPELGNLANLEELWLAENYLEGPIPHQLGRLDSLKVLDLHYNEYLTGEIPDSLGNLARLETLRLDRNQLTGSIPPALGNLGALERLDLYENRLTGALPESLGRLGALRTLKAHNNALTGPLPDAISSLRSLEELWVGNNPEMSGPLPLDMAELAALESFKAGGTELCAPDDEALLDWLVGVPFHRVARCEAAAAHLTQAVQSRTDPVPLIAGKPALLRAFVASPEASGEAMPAARATLYLDGSPVHRVDIEGGSGTIPNRIEESEGSLERSINTDVPGDLVRPGLEFVVEVDPDGTLDSALAVTRRIPATGRMAVDVVQPRDLQLTVVPFLHEVEPDSSILEITAGMASDPGTHEMLEGVRVLLPVGDIGIELHDPVVTFDDLGFEILRQTEMIRLMEGRPGYWLGMQGPARLGLLGVAWDIPSWSSFSQPLPSVIAHEIGHNMGLWHAPCGGAGGPDPLYPHPRGVIDSWGYDMANKRLVSPYAPDLMSYCGGQWIGDYHHANALRHRLSTEADASFAARVSSLVVWGGMDGDGTLHLEPAFITDAMPSLPTEGRDFTLRATTADGGEAFRLRFDMPATQDAEGGRTGFVFSVPITWTGALESIVLLGGGRTTSMTRDTDRPVTILRDRATGQVRAFLRGRRPMAVAMDGLANAMGTPDYEVLFSAGIPQ